MQALVFTTVLVSVCTTVCVFVRKALVFLFAQTGVFDLGTGPQGWLLPPTTQSLSDTESQREREGGGGGGREEKERIRKGWEGSERNRERERERWRAEARDRKDIREAERVRGKRGGLRSRNGGNKGFIEEKWGRKNGCEGRGRKREWGKQWLQCQKTTEDRVQVCGYVCVVLAIDKSIEELQIRRKMVEGTEVYSDSLILCINILHLEARDYGNWYARSWIIHVILQSNYSEIIK